MNKALTALLKKHRPYLKVINIGLKAKIAPSTMSQILGGESTRHMTDEQERAVNNCLQALCKDLSNYLEKNFADSK